MLPSPVVEPELTLIELLELKARSEGLSNIELCRRIGFDHSMLSRVRRGLDAFGVGTCALIVDRYPDLGRAAARYLRSRYSERQLALLGLASRLATTDDDTDA